jgi:uncharacterized coiled-coil protein SlyX
LAALLLLSLPLFSEDVYEITETELTELERILSEQETTISEQAETLTQLQTTIGKQRDTLTTLSTTIETQQRTIGELQISYDVSETEARRAKIRVGIVSFSIGGALGIIGGLLF